MDYPIYQRLCKREKLEDTTNMGKLKTDIKLLLPIDSKSKVDKLIALLQLRNAVIDTQMFL